MLTLKEVVEAVELIKESGSEKSQKQGENQDSSESPNQRETGHTLGLSLGQ